ncbi:MAG TPA: hypothetical protein VFD04_18130 [Actinomycetes bacterium]|jgi:hypothetical protein|nr:hypothetical protein [Actinomycetes bacterium]
MRLGTAVFLVVLGAILRFAVTAHLSWLNLQVVGTIVLTVGAVYLLLGTYRLLLAAGRRRHAQPVGPVLAELTEEPYPPEQPEPSRIAEEIDRAHVLAYEARSMLAAEGYSNQRIDELALAFIANDVGWGREEFISWALTQGRAGRDPSVDA